MLHAVPPEVAIPCFRYASLIRHRYAPRGENPDAVIGKFGILVSSFFLPFMAGWHTRCQPLGAHLLAHLDGRGWGEFDAALDHHVSKLDEFVAKGAGFQVFYLLMNSPSSSDSILKANIWLGPLL